MKPGLQGFRQLFLVLIAEGVFDDGPEIHCQSADLNFGVYFSVTKGTENRISNDQVIALITALFRNSTA
ncbi:hypothetical protein SDC9_207642 [bioreactor metagenome]|uniref:Uncharacterized protein n=1 Tax=bioreactor metagenome TaxID=1076179 RepID=A0A645J9U7_9ZZZZ